MRTFQCAFFIYSRTLLLRFRIYNYIKERIDGKMVYTKEAIISQIMFKYKINHYQAEVLYNAYKKSDNLTLLASFIFES